LMLPRCHPCDPINAPLHAAPVPCDLVLRAGIDSHAAPFSLPIPKPIILPLHKKKREKKPPDSRSPSRRRPPLERGAGGRQSGRPGSPVARCQLHHRGRLRRPPIRRPDPHRQWDRHRGPRRLLSLPVAPGAGRGGEGHSTTLQHMVRCCPPSLPPWLAFSCPDLIRPLC
jgi:hypothetical protein